MPSVQKLGDSLGGRIPKAIARQARLAPGTEVEFDTSGGVLTIRPMRRRRPSLASLLAKAKGPSPYRYADRDRPMGRELI
jgi:antitoxin component of MazEF toxin-antitoxin module